MVNNFPARDRKFIQDLADDLHLSVTWDEYNEDDQNLVTWRFPGELEEPVPENGNNGHAEDGEDDDEWEDEEDEESRVAVDRVLTKYSKARVADDDREGDFDARYEMSIKEKMDDWKRTYYKVRELHMTHIVLHQGADVALDRANLRYRTTIHSKCMIWCTVTWRVCSGSCTTITAAWHRGVGSITTIMPLESPVSSRSPGSDNKYSLFIDLKGVDQMTFHFDLGKPFRPYEQLMGVLPAASKELIPPAYRVCFEAE